MCEIEVDRLLRKSKTGLQTLESIVVSKYIVCLVVAVGRLVCRLAMLYLEGILGRQGADGRQLPPVRGGLLGGRGGGGGAGLLLLPGVAQVPVAARLDRGE